MTLPPSIEVPLASSLLLSPLYKGEQTPSSTPRPPTCASMASIIDLGQSGSSQRCLMAPSFRDGEPTQMGSEVEEVEWAKLERLPTYDRMRKGILRHEAQVKEVDLWHLGDSERKLIAERILEDVDQDNERFLRRLRGRFDRVGIALPTIEVRYERLCVEAETYVGRRALPSLPNAAMNAVEDILGLFGMIPSKKRPNKILRGVSGILKPSRMTLLLGPPGSGKTTLLKSLAGMLDKDLKVSGKITYCGHELSEFVPQRACAYISQNDLHTGEMTVRETLDFSTRCLGVGSRYEMLSELIRREKAEGIKPDLVIDAFMKAIALNGQKNSLITEYVLKVLGLDICADIIVGDEMRRGISGGQKKRVTTGEMLAGPARTLFMDEISNGLDSSTTLQLVKFIRQLVHVMDATVIVSLLQPAPEVFALFDDIILLSEGQIVYHGPRDNVLEFFELMGFRCPERKGVADFLQEVTSKKDQKQYWFSESQPYRFLSVSEFTQFFGSFHIGQQLSKDLKIPYDKYGVHPELVTEKYGISSWEHLKACFSREWLLMKRNSFLYIFKTTQIIIMAVITMTVFLRTQMHDKTIADGGKYFSALFYSLLNVMFNGMAEMPMTVGRLPVFYKQRDFMLYPSWAFGLSYCIIKIPISLLESGLWLALTYYVIGFAPAAGRFFRQFLAFFFAHQMTLSLFRFIAAAGRTMLNASTFGTFIFLAVFVLGGFVISRDDIQPWWIWGYWISPMTYGQNAVAINEFLDSRWNTPNNDSRINASTIGEAILKSRGMLVNGYWYWISIGALIGFCLLFNACFILALTYLNPLGNSHALVVDEDAHLKHKEKKLSNTDQKSKLTGMSTLPTSTAENQQKRGMVLPFQPLSLAFNHVNYYVDMPDEMKNQVVKETRLQLLCDVSGAFRPGVLTALVGVSGAGKTTLMDVLAGRKTRGYIEGSISISGYPKNQATFARVSGYCEQYDIHSPYVTVYESVTFSAWLRLPPEIGLETRKMFVEEVLELVELDQLRDALVGLPGVDGLSTEQRKRLTIAVELVANPSIIFMDEPTSGLDARAAAIVMRAVRNTVDTGRTVVCTIHQPSIDIFEAFDELLLMKRGGRLIYAGALGSRSHKLIEYFESIPGVPKIKDGENPATWMLEISSPSVEAHVNLDFAEVYRCSSLYQRNQELIKELSTPAPGSMDLFFPTKYTQSYTIQGMACFWKQQRSYWRNPQYNAIRFFMTIIIGLLFGTIFWNMGETINKQQDVYNILGAIYSAVFFLGTTIATTLQPVVAVERTSFYRERAAGMYSSFSYAFAQVAVEVIYIAVQSLVYSMLLFSLIGFGWQLDKFFWFFYFIFMSFVYFALYGMMAVAISPNLEIAGIISAFFFSFWNLFSGFLIAKPLIPVWWRWYCWVSPVNWTIYGLVESQVGNKDNLVQIPGQASLPLNVLLREMLGYEERYVGSVALAHVGFITFFFFIFAYSIRLLNYQNR